MTSARSCTEVAPHVSKPTTAAATLRVSGAGITPSDVGKVQVLPVER